MYADREGKSRRQEKEQISLDNSQKPMIGPWTLKLLEFEENDEERWGHSGFKAMYGGREASCNLSLGQKKKKKYPKIVISETESESGESCNGNKANGVRTYSRVNNPLPVNKMRKTAQDSLIDGEWVERVVIRPKEMSSVGLPSHTVSRRRGLQDSEDSNEDTNYNEAYLKPSVRSLALKLNRSALPQVVSDSSDESGSQKVEFANGAKVLKDSQLVDEVSRDSLRCSIHQVHKHEHDVDGRRSLLVAQGSLAKERSSASSLAASRDPNDLRAKVLSKKVLKENPYTKPTSESSSLSDSESEDDIALRKKLLKKY